jgi:hypothetical protein
MDLFLSETKKKLKTQIEEECTKHLDSVFAAEFDKYVRKAIDDIKDVAIYPTGREYAINTYTSTSNNIVDVYIVNTVGRYNSQEKYIIDNYGNCYTCSCSSYNYNIITSTNPENYLYPLPKYLLECIKNFPPTVYEYTVYESKITKLCEKIREFAKSIFETSLLVNNIVSDNEQLAKENAELKACIAKMEAAAPCDDLLGL